MRFKLHRSLCAKTTVKIQPFWKTELSKNDIVALRCIFMTRAAALNCWLFDRHVHGVLISGIKVNTNGEVLFLQSERLENVT